MNERVFPGHLSAEALQGLLDGTLPPGERGPAEEHLASCARCAAEVQGWRALFRELGALPGLAPSARFSEAVMAQVSPVPRSPRLLGWWGAAARSAHPSSGLLQELVEGGIPARQAARVRAHLAACPACARESVAWQATFAGLGSLERLPPSGDFAVRVMAQVRIPTQAPAPMPKRRPVLGWMAGLVPQTRRAWAALSGIALAPVVTFGAVAWAAFSGPALTPGALASFAWWKVSDFAAVAWNVVAGRAMESTGLFEIFSLVESLAMSPSAVMGSFAGLSAGTAAACWVLYRNLVVTRPLGVEVVRASHS